MTPEDTLTLIPMVMFISLILAVIWIGLSGSSNG